MCVLDVYMAIKIEFAKLFYFIYLFSHQITPLHLAAGKGHVDTVRCLVDKGADTQLKDGNDVSD